MPPEEPPYLVPGAPPWTAEYPPGFRQRLPAGTGYDFQAGGPGDEHAGGYYVNTDRRRYDVQQNAAGTGRGLSTGVMDPLGNVTAVEYDTPYELLPKRVTDAAGLVASAIYDYRVLSVSALTEANGNETHFTFTPLGMLASTAVMGKPGEAVGDTDVVPSARLSYDFRAYLNTGQPALCGTRGGCITSRMLACRCPSGTAPSNRSIISTASAA